MPCIYLATTTSFRQQAFPLLPGGKVQYVNSVAPGCLPRGPAAAAGLPAPWLFVWWPCDEG
eukprot:scaffold112710_cov13-Tisochrysis_lutea.AAC.1